MYEEVCATYCNNGGACDLKESSMVSFYIYSPWLFCGVDSTGQLISTQIVTSFIEFLIDNVNKTF
jgi:hypothetical protein